MSRYSLRHPRTFQELKAGEIRAKRRNIPTAYNDISRCNQRSWKVHRKTKWRRLAGWTHKRAMRWLNEMSAIYQKQGKSR